MPLYHDMFSGSYQAIVTSFFILLTLECFAIRYRPVSLEKVKAMTVEGKSIYFLT